MEIKIAWKGRVFAIAIGRNTLWFSQVYLISITEEFYDPKNSFELYYATMIWGFWKKEIKDEHKEI